MRNVLSFQSHRRHDIRKEIRCLLYERRHLCTSPPPLAPPPPSSPSPCSAAQYTCECEMDKMGRRSQTTCFEYVLETLVASACLSPTKTSNRLLGIHEAPRWVCLFFPACSSAGCILKFRLTAADKRNEEASGEAGWCDARSVIAHTFLIYEFHRQTTTIQPKQLIGSSSTSSHQHLRANGATILRRLALVETHHDVLRLFWTVIIAISPCLPIKALFS